MSSPSAIAGVRRFLIGLCRFLGRNKIVDRIEAHRLFFANLVTAQAGIPPGSELAAALASTPREQFVGPPPWKVFTRSGYVETLTDDPAVLYQDVVVSLGGEGPLNNGQPTLHALCLATLAPKNGERVIHVGAGTGYYTTLLAKLVGESGVVDAYEIEPTLAQRATDNLAKFSNVTVHARSGAEATLPACDVLYVNAGATEPLAVWLDALRPKGRLLFPMTRVLEPCCSSRNKRLEPSQLVFSYRYSLFPASGQETKQRHKSLRKPFRAALGPRSGPCIETMRWTAVAGVLARGGGFRRTERYSIEPSQRGPHVC